MGLKREKAEAVIHDVYESSLTHALKKHGVKSQNFFKLLSEVPLLDEAYARAQQGRSEIFMDEIIEIADNEDDAQRARNRIEVRKLYASKMKPNKFGDRIDINLNTQVDIRGALDEAKNRIRDVIEIQKPQLIDTTIDLQNQKAGQQPVAVEAADFKTTLDELLD